MAEKVLNQAILSLYNYLTSSDPQNIGGQFGTLLGFLRNTLKKGPEIYLGPKRVRTILEKRTTAYSLGAPLLGLAKFTY